VLDLYKQFLIERITEVPELSGERLFQDCGGAATPAASRWSDPKPIQAQIDRLKKERKNLSDAFASGQPFEVVRLGLEDRQGRLFRPELVARACCAGWRGDP
jgi:hypothetical protein